MHFIQRKHFSKTNVTSRPVTRGISPTLEKCIGHSSKNLGPSQKTLRPSWCPKLVTGLVTSHAFEQISDLKIFPECFRGPLKTLWQATCGPRACSWTTLIYLTQHQNIDLYSFIACEPQSFKRVFYLKQIFVITGAPLERRARGNCPRCPPP